MNYRLIIVLIVLANAINCFSQTGYGESLEKSIFAGIATPTAQDLGKYAEIPMNYYSGRANVTIPLYSTTQRNVPLNISMSYDTGGLLVNQLPSWTGHGWTLNCGGCITRKLQEHYDEDENQAIKTGKSKVKLVNYFKNTLKIENCSDETIGNNKTNISTVYDYSPDIFVFNFMGKTGRFFLGTDKKWHVQCEENIKVVFDINDQSNYILPFIEQYPNTGLNMSKTIKGFTLVDEDGIRYKFGGTTDAIEYSISFFDQDIDDWRANSWYLTEVRDRLGNVLYSFTYKRGKFITQIFNNLCMTAVDTRYSTKNYYSMIDKLFYTALMIGWTESSKHEMYVESTYDFPYVVSLNAPVYLSKIKTLDRKIIDFNMSESICIPETDFYKSFEEYCSYNFMRRSGEPYRSDAKIPYIAQFQNSKRNYHYLCYLRNHMGFAKDYPLYWDANMRKKVEKEESNNTSLPWLDKPWNNPLSVLSFSPLQSIDVSCIDDMNKYKCMKSIDFVYDKDPRLHITAINMYGANGKNDVSQAYKMEYNDYDKLPSDYLTLKTDFWGFYNGDDQNNDVDIVKSRYGTLSKLIYPTGGFSKFEYEQNTFSQYQNDIKNGMRIFFSDQYTGGLRIKSIKDYSKENELFKSRTFSYSCPDENISSGQCYSLPRTVSEDFQSSMYTSERRIYNYKKSSAIPLTDSYNSHIGYSWVTEIQENGTKKEYKFTNYSDYLDEYPIRVANKSWYEYDQRSYSIYNKYADLGFARGKILKETVYDNNHIRYQCDYIYNSRDVNRYVLSTNLSLISNSIAQIDRYLVGCVYKLYYCNLELSKKKEMTYPVSGAVIEDVTEYKMEDWYPNKNDQSFSLRKLMSEKTTRWAKNKPFDSQEKQYHYLSSELSDYFFPLTSINTFRNGQEVKRESFIYGYDASGITSNQKILTKETYAQYPDFKERTKVTYDLYDKNGQLLQFTEPGKGTTYLTWNNGKLIKTARGSADSHITTYGYTPDGLLNRTTTPNGYVTNYNYDSFGRLGEVSDSNGILQKYDYNLKNK